MTPAVLLIVGAAVIGPIEGRSCQSLMEFGAEQFTRPCPPETMPELCARAMKEIGVPEIAFYPDGRTGGVLPGATYEQDTVVRCIPAPEGYRR